MAESSPITILDLRSHWETKVAELARHLHAARDQLTTEEHEVREAKAALQRAQRRIELAEQKVEQAKEVLHRAQGEYEFARETLIVLRHPENYVGP